MPRAVLIRYDDGREYVIEGGASVAREVHPEAAVVAFSDDGSAYAPAGRRRPAYESAQVVVAIPSADEGAPF